MAKGGRASAVCWDIVGRDQKECVLKGECVDADDEENDENGGEEE